MQYCLNKEEIDLLLSNDWEIKEDFPDELKPLLENSQNWHVELVCLTYLLSKVLERKQKNGIDCDVLLRQAMNITNEMWLSYQDSDLEFVKYLFRHVRKNELDLESNLIDIQNRLSEHIYD